MLSNPFKPTAGKNPPVLIGRDQVLDEFVEGIENGAGAPNRLMRISGMRGMGKTVMLNEIGDRARQLGWEVINETASEGFCERILNEVLPDYRVSRVTADPSIMGLSMGSVELDRAAMPLRTGLDQLIERNGNGLLITLDEVQDASLNEMRALSVAIQHEIREDRDIAFVFAGLPSMIENVVNGKTLTFLRRAVPIELGPVAIPAVSVSLVNTFEQSGLPLLNPSLASTLADSTRGYPFMVQLVGYHVWQKAKRAGRGSVDEECVRQGIVLAWARFDSTVIEPALQRMPMTSLEYLLAMAVDRGRVSESGEVAARLEKTQQQLSAIRARLIKEDVIESAGWGKMSFSIPYMAEYLNEHEEELRAEIAGR